MKKLPLSVRQALDVAMTDSEVREIAEIYNLDVAVCCDYVSRSHAEGRCKDCRHIGLYPSMYPCNACVGGKEGDYYEQIGSSTLMTRRGETLNSTGECK